MTRPPAPSRAAPPRCPALPEGWRLPSPGACAGVALATRAPPSPTPSRAFLTFERLWEAVAREDATLDDTVRLSRTVTTVGRHLVSACLPRSIVRAMGDRAWSAWSLRRALARVTREVHVEVAARSASALEALGTWVLSRSGLSLAMGDFQPPRARAAIREETLGQLARLTRDTYEEGLYTFGEHYQRTVDLWSHATERERCAAREEHPEPDALAALCAGALPHLSPPSLRAMKGLHARRSGEIVERPVLHHAGDGFDPHEAMILWLALRGAELRDREHDRELGPTLQDLSEVFSKTRVVTRDCGTVKGARLGPLETPLGDPIQSLSERITGRVTSEDVVSRDGRTLAPAGTLLDARRARLLEAEHLPWVAVRDPLWCEAEGGVCARCLGLDPDDATWFQTGDEVGARAALSLGEALRGFGTRWFHVC